MNIHVMKMVKIFVVLFAIIGFTYSAVFLSVFMLKPDICVTDTIGRALSPDRKKSVILEQKICKKNNEIVSNYLYVSLYSYTNRLSETIFIGEILSDQGNPAESINILWSTDNLIIISRDENIRPSLQREHVESVEIQFNSEFLRRETSGENIHEFGVHNSESETDKILDVIQKAHPWTAVDYEVHGPHLVTLLEESKGIGVAGEQFWSVRLYTQDYKLAASYFVNPKTYEVYTIHIHDGHN